MTRTRYGNTMAQPRTQVLLLSEVSSVALELPRYMSVTQVSQKKAIPEKSNRRQNWNTQDPSLG